MWMSMGKKAFRLTGKSPIWQGCRFTPGSTSVQMRSRKQSTLRWTDNTTMIYTHVLYRGPMGVISPADYL